MRYEKDYSDHYVVAYYRNKAAREKIDRIKIAIVAVWIILGFVLETVL